MSAPIKRGWATALGVAFWTSVAAVIAWPVFSADAEPPCDGNAIASPRQIPVTLDRGGTFALPGEWHWTQSPAGEHFVLGIAAATNPCAVVDIVRVTPTTVTIEAVRTSVLQPEDAFVSVSATYMPAMDSVELPRLPKEIGIDDLKSGEELWEEPIYTARSGSVDWHAEYLVSYWVGPEASKEDRAEARTALASLRLR